MNPYDAAHALARALRESAEFKEMKEAQAELKADQTAYKMLLDFRKEQLNLQKQVLSGIEVSKEQEEKVDRLSQIVNMNTTAGRFMQAEYRAAVLLQDIQKIIGEAAEEIIDRELTAMMMNGESEGEHEQE